MVRKRRVRYTADIRCRAKNSSYTNPVFRATMALEAGAESHVGAPPYRTAEVLHTSRVGVLRGFAIKKMWRRNPP